MAARILCMQYAMVVGSLVCQHLPLRGSGPRGIIFMAVWPLFPWPAMSMYYTMQNNYNKLNIIMYLSMDYIKL